MSAAVLPSPGLARRCGSCRHFRDDPAAVEEAFPGLAAMGSGYGSVRAGDGLCARHDCYLAAWDCCPDFEACPGRSRP